VASDHEIEVLEGLIAVMTAREAFVNSSPGGESVRARQRRVLIGRVQGLGAQIVALGGVWKVAAIDAVDMAAPAHKPPDRDESGAATQAWAALRPLSEPPSKASRSGRRRVRRSIRHGPFSKPSSTTRFSSRRCDNTLILA